MWKGWAFLIRFHTTLLTTSLPLFESALQQWVQKQPFLFILLALQGELLGLSECSCAAYFIIHLHYISSDNLALSFLGGILHLVFWLIFIFECFPNIAYLWPHIAWYRVWTVLPKCLFFTTLKSALIKQTNHIFPLLFSFQPFPYSFLSIAGNCFSAWKLQSEHWEITDIVKCFYTTCCIVGRYKKIGWFLLCKKNTTMPRW